MPETLQYQPRRRTRSAYGNDNDAVLIVLLLVCAMLAVNVVGIRRPDWELMRVVAFLGLFIFPVPNTTSLMIVWQELRNRRSKFCVFVMVVAALTATSTLYAWYLAVQQLLQRMPN